MNVSVLIDAIVRQTMVLVAQLATTAGMRAPLTNVANQVFLKLVQELEAQGVRQKVIADMFGLALRSYQRKVQRLLESETERGRSLWEAVLGYVADKERVSRADVMRRFRYDDEAMVRGVLDDLVNTGLVYRKGRGDTTLYRASAEEDLYAGDVDRGDADAALVWVFVYRNAPVTIDEIEAALRLDRSEVEDAVRRLVEEERVSADQDADPVTYACNAFFTAYDEPSGWEAALFDHYQAMVVAMVTKLQAGSNRAQRADVVGGSTYSYDVWPGHPFQERVLGFLSRVRSEADTLLEEVHRFNESSSRPPNFSRVSFYVGQSVQSDEEFNGDS